MNLYQQILSFLFVSGIGWLSDFSIYFCLTEFGGLPILAANCISAVPSVLWVFWVSSRKIFKASKSRLNLYQKYLIYFSYQLLLVISISFLAKYLHTWFTASEFVSVQLLRDYSKMIIKILITPVTMTMNFIAAKSLIEKL